MPLFSNELCAITGHSFQTHFTLTLHLHESLKTAASVRCVNT